MTSASIVSAAPTTASTLNGTPKSRGSDNARTPGCWSRSPNASSDVTGYPALAADSAIALVETPTSNTRGSAGTLATHNAEAGVRRRRRNEHDVVQHSSRRVLDAEPLHEGCFLASGKPVRDECRALRALLRVRREPAQLVDRELGRDGR